MTVCSVRPPEPGGVQSLAGAGSVQSLAGAGSVQSLSGRRNKTAGLTDRQLAARVMSPLARCAYAALDPDEWFPVAVRPETARAEARTALALCAACPVRAECLEFALRHRRGVGRHGIWGGLVEAERASAYRGWAAGAPVETLLR